MQDMELNRYWETVVDTIQDGVMVVDVGGTGCSGLVWQPGTPKNDAKSYESGRR